MTLTQADVVTAAVDLLDEVGLQQLTLRRLADRLGVRAPTLYWHVDDKRTLLDLMAARILADAQPDAMDEPLPGQPWWAWLGDRSRAMFAALVAHRDAPLVVAGNRPTTADLPRVDRLLRVLADHGLHPTDAMTILFAIGNYVIGSAVEWQAESQRSVDAEGGRAAMETVALLHEDPDAFPTLRAAFQGMQAQDQTTTFERGLGMLLDGLRAQHADRP